MAEADPHSVITDNPCRIDVNGERGKLLNAFAKLENALAALADKYNVDPKATAPFGQRIECVKGALIAAKVKPNRIETLIKKLQSLTSTRGHLIHSVAELAISQETGELLYIFKHVAVAPYSSTVMTEVEWRAY
jgi:hypothetical protein